MPRTLFPWLLAEDNPVISCYGNNSLNQAGTTRSCSARDKLPESTGDKLAAWGDMNSNFPGETGLDSSGEFDMLGK